MSWEHVRLGCLNGKVRVDLTHCDEMTYEMSG